MPVRFRCAYCNQLLGISHRKIGSVVRCPTCAGQVVVPNPEAVATERPAANVPAPLFERSDFDELFNAPAAADRPVSLAADPRPSQVAKGVGAPVAPWTGRAAPTFDVERVHSEDELPGLRPAGIILSPLKAAVLTVLFIVAIALAFGAGLFVGRSL